MLLSSAFWKSHTHFLFCPPIVAGRVAASFGQAGAGGALPPISSALSLSLLLLSFRFLLSVQMVTPAGKVARISDSYSLSLSVLCAALLNICGMGEKRRLHIASTYDF